MLATPVTNLSTEDFDFTYVIRSYERTSSTLLVEYYSDNLTHLPVGITFHAADFKNSDGSLNEEKLHAEIKRIAPIFHWRTSETTVDNKELFKDVLNVTYAGKASETEAALVNEPLDRTFGWPEKMHQLNKQRNLYLYATDWVDLPNCTLDEETKNQWRVWRQAIRDMVSPDITTDVDPTKLPFPEPPGGWKNFLNENVIVYPGMHTFGMNPYTDEDIERISNRAAAL